MNEVLLVGNSSALLNENNAELIDSFPLVVRMNGGKPTDENRHAIGSKTTHWSFSTMRPNQYWGWKIKGAEQMCLNRRCGYEFVTGEAIWTDPDTYADLIETYDAERPSTGLITAHYILRNWVDSVLFLIGFDFFESGTWYCPNRVQTPHDWDKEREYMRSLGINVI